MFKYFSMFKKSLLGLFSLFLVGFAFWMAENKTNRFDQLRSLHVGQSTNDLDYLGRPISSDERERIYFLPNHSTLVLSLFDGKVNGAWLKLKKPIQIQDFAPWAEKLKFVQIQVQDENPYYFYAGSPHDGQVFKVNREGLIESVTWLRPFDSSNTPKNLQALYNEFSFNIKSQM